MKHHLCLADDDDDARAGGVRGTAGVLVGDGPAHTVAVGRPGLDYFLYLLLLLLSLSLLTSAWSSTRLSSR